MSSRPSSASGLLPTHQMPNQGYGHGSGSRNNFRGFPPQAAGAFRGSVGPVQPYAFTATPNLNPHAMAWQPAPATRASSTPAVPTMQSFEQSPNFGQRRYPATGSMTNPPSTSNRMYSPGSRDDSAIPGTTRRFPAAPRPQSSHMSVSYAQALQNGTPARNTPDRYRRPVARNNEISGVAQQQSLSHSSAPPSAPGTRTS
jgi:hypothetical protein